ncbi:MAG: hypothetical protein MIO92_07330, partial [Methanosarcinaceae archaeon]|nr:hypothetical protein [Methanosarcinaceae archaeon]
AKFSVFDARDPLDLVEIGSLDLPSEQAIVVSGNFAYVAIDNQPYVLKHYLAVLDISDPANPYIFRTLDIHSNCWKLKIEKYENYLYIIKYIEIDPLVDIIQLW